MPDLFGSRIRKLRVSRRWSQQELSIRAGISTPHISSIERGKRQPSLEYARRLANALGVRIHELCDEKKDFEIPRMKHSTEEWPPAMQNFILNEAAAPYLEAAKRMSTLPHDYAMFLRHMIDLLSITPEGEDEK